MEHGQGSSLPGLQAAALGHPDKDSEEDKDKDSEQDKDKDQFKCPQDKDIVQSKDQLVWKMLTLDQMILAGHFFQMERMYEKCRAGQVGPHHLETLAAAAVLAWREHIKDLSLLLHPPPPRQISTEEFMTVPISLEV